MDRKLQGGSSGLQYMREREREREDGETKLVVDVICGGEYGMASLPVAACVLLLASSPPLPLSLPNGKK